jgi:hypothetical protein
MRAHRWEQRFFFPQGLLTLLPSVRQSETDMHAGPVRRVLGLGFSSAAAPTRSPALPCLLQLGIPI